MARFFVFTESSRPVGDGFKTECRGALKGPKALCVTRHMTVLK